MIMINNYSNISLDVYLDMYTFSLFLYLHFMLFLLYLDETQSEPKRSVADMHCATEGQPRTQRLSLIDLLTGDLGSRSHMNHQSNSSSTIKTTQPSQVSAPPNGIQTARGMSF